MDEHSSLPQGQYQARVRWNTQASGAAFDRKKRSFLSTEAQEFLAQRTMCVIAAMHGQETLTGRLVFGPPGFAWSTESSTCLLELDEGAINSTFINDLYRHPHTEDNGQVGLFFINHATRERLCVHGKAEVLSRYAFASRLLLRFQRPSRLRLHVRQAFFHCPRYIRTAIAGLTAPAVVRFDREAFLREFQGGARKALSAPLCDFLQQQISCFLCTANRQNACSVNHRGGAPGFLTTLLPDEDAPGGRLLLPDYKGNGAFEAIGNIFETGLVTLIVPDYSMQAALVISGIASILEPSELSPDLRTRCVGAERVISLTVRRIVMQSGDWTLPLAYEQAAAGIAKRQKSEILCPIERSTALK